MLIEALSQQGMRDKTHKGAQCQPCAHYLNTKGVALGPRSTCLARLTCVLAQVKGCQYHPQATKQQGMLEHKKLKSNKRPANQLPFNMATSGETQLQGSNSSNKQLGMQQFMALKDSAELNKLALKDQGWHACNEVCCDVHQVYLTESFWQHLQALLTKPKPLKDWT